MKSKKPNKILSPLIIAGITIGFLGAAYKFIFIPAKKDTQKELEAKVPETDEFN